MLSDEVREWLEEVEGLFMLMEKYNILRYSNELHEVVRPVPGTSVQQFIDEANEGVTDEDILFNPSKGLEKING